MKSIKNLKKDFPIFRQQVRGRPLAYLDNASTTQKPRSVIDAETDYYLTMNANIHRGIHELSEKATEAFENTRERVARFIHARETSEIVFTRNATEAINLVAYTWGEKNIRQGDEITVSVLEHHSNLVPWQELCRRKGAVLRIIPLAKDGQLDLHQLDSFISKKCKIVAVTQMSNVLGTVVPLDPIIQQAHKVGAVVVVDGAQGVPHLGIDVKNLDCDFLAFSAHKMLGPTGVGVLYGKKELLTVMPPFLFGGDMVKEVETFSAKWNDLPWKFEAGTPNISGVVSFAKALEYLENIGFDAIAQHDHELVRHARQMLSTLPGIELYGPADSSGILSFNIPTVHPHDVASILNEEGIAIRAGHHCAQPLTESLGVNATARMSFYIYNEESEINRAYEALLKVYDIFKVKQVNKHSFAAS